MWLLFLVLRARLHANIASKSGGHDFLLVIHADHAPTSYRFRDKKAMIAILLTFTDGVPGVYYL